MAFTDSEKAAIREALGYAGVTTSPYFVLEGRMTAADADTVTRCRTLLTQIAAIDTQFAASAISDMRFDAVEDVKFHHGAGGGPMGMLAARDVLVRRLSNNLGVPINAGANSTGAVPYRLG